jgi:hypothetical protein
LPQEEPVLTSASALFLTAISAPAPADITPSSLAVRPAAVELNEAPYDWTLQQGRGASGLKLADNTANCNTGPTPTNIGGHADSVPDCGFD